MPRVTPCEVAESVSSCGAAFGLGRRFTRLSTVARRRSARAPWARRFLAWSATPVIRRGRPKSREQEEVTPGAGCLCNVTCPQSEFCP